MSRSKRLQLVLELAQSTEDKASEAYEMANGLYQSDVKKLEELCGYYDEYEHTFSNSPRCMRAEEIVRQRGFLMQLSDAKAQQTQIIAQRKKIADLKKSAWQKAHLKRRAMSDLIARLKVDEEKLLSRKEEKMLDEWFIQSSQSRPQSSTFQ